MAQRVGRSFADLVTALQELQAGLKEGAQARDLAAKVIAYLESQLGKSSPALQRYGVARRIPGRKASSQAKAPQA